MLHKIDFDNLDTEKQKSNAIRQLQAARNVLCEKGCADPYGTNGHDPEAEQLKQDIDKMLEELGAEPEPPDQRWMIRRIRAEQPEEEQKKKSRREQQLEKELNEQKQENHGRERQKRRISNQRDDKEGSATRYSWRWTRIMKRIVMEKSDR